MKKKIVNHSSNFRDIIFRIVFILIAFLLLAKNSRNNINADKKELDEMRVYHSDKGFTTEEHGLLIIDKD